MEGGERVAMQAMICVYRLWSQQGNQSLCPLPTFIFTHVRTNFLSTLSASCLLERCRGTNTHQQAKVFSSKSVRALMRAFKSLRTCRRHLRGRGRGVRDHRLECCEGTWVQPRSNSNASDLSPANRHGKSADEVAAYGSTYAQSLSLARC